MILKIMMSNSLRYAVAPIFDGRYDPKPFLALLNGYLPSFMQRNEAFDLNSNAILTLQNQPIQDRVSVTQHEGVPGILINDGTTQTIEATVLRASVGVELGMAFCDANFGVPQFIGRYGPLCNYFQYNPGDPVTYIRIADSSEEDSFLLGGFGAGLADMTGELLTPERRLLSFSPGRSTSLAQVTFDYGPEGRLFGLVRPFAAFNYIPTIEQSLPTFNGPFPSLLGPLRHVLILRTVFYIQIPDRAYSSFIEPSKLDMCVTVPFNVVPTASRDNRVFSFPDPVLGGATQALTFWVSTLANNGSVGGDTASFAGNVSTQIGTVPINISSAFSATSVNVLPSSDNLALNPGMPSFIPYTNPGPL